MCVFVPALNEAGKQSSLFLCVLCVPSVSSVFQVGVPVRVAP